MAKFKTGSPNKINGISFIFFLHMNIYRKYLKDSVNQKYFITSWSRLWNLPNSLLILTSSDWFWETVVVLKVLKIENLSLIDNNPIDYLSFLNIDLGGGVRGVKQDVLKTSPWSPGSGWSSTWSSSTEPAGSITVPDLPIDNSEPFPGEEGEMVGILDILVLLLKAFLTWDMMKVLMNYWIRF